MTALSFFTRIRSNLYSVYVWRRLSPPQVTTMNPEDSQRLEACLQEAAEILYQNTPAEEMTNFESLEKVVRTKILEQVSPKIAVFLSNKS